MTSSLPAFVLRRIVAAVLFVLVVSSSALFLVRLAPGDAATDLVIREANPEVIEATRTRLGLDRPILVQLGNWLTGVARFDLGQSSVYGRPVGGLVLDRMGNTALLAAMALILATLVGVPLGVWSGTHPSTWAARVITVASLVLVACPPIIATLALLLLAATAGWPPTLPGSLVLPVIALTLPLAAAIERLQSQASAEALGLPHVRAAAARGVPAGRLVWVHGLRPSLQPLLGVYGVVIATLFSGSVAVETITAWPGLGRLMLDGLLGRDLFLVAGCALAGSALLAAGNLVADMLRVTTDPRLREGA